MLGLLHNSRGDWVMRYALEISSVIGYLGRYIWIA